MDRLHAIQFKYIINTRPNNTSLQGHHYSYNK
jgi:hypothetical protein